MKVRPVLCLSPHDGVSEGRACPVLCLSPHGGVSEGKACPVLCLSAHGGVSEGKACPVLESPLTAAAVHSCLTTLPNSKDQKLYARPEFWFCNCCCCVCTLFMMFLGYF